VGFESGMSPFFPNPPAANTVTECRFYAAAVERGWTLEEAAFGPRALERLQMFVTPADRYAHSTPATPPGSTVTTSGRDDVSWCTQTVLAAEAYLLA
jgi:hypothetical protein